MRPAVYFTAGTCMREAVTPPKPTRLALLPVAMRNSCSVTSRVRVARSLASWCRATNTDAPCPSASANSGTPVVSELFNRSGTLHRFDKHRVRVAVPRLNTRALGPRPGPGPLHLDNGAHGEVDIALRGQWRGVDGGVEKQVVTLLEHEGLNMAMAENTNYEGR